MKNKSVHKNVSVVDKVHGLSIKTTKVTLKVSLFEVFLNKRMFGLMKTL